MSTDILGARLKRDLRRHHVAIRCHQKAFDNFYQLLTTHVVNHQREIGSYYHMDWGSSRTHKYVALRFDDDRNIIVRIVRIPDFPKKGDNAPWYHVVFLVSIPWWHKKNDLPLIHEMCMEMHRKFFQIRGHMWSYNDMKNYTIFVNGLQKGGRIDRRENWRNQQDMHMFTSSVRSWRHSSIKEYVLFIRQQIIGRLRRFFYKRIDRFYQTTKKKYIFGKLKHYVICLGKFSKVLKTMAHGLRMKLKDIYAKTKKKGVRSLHSKTKALNPTNAIRRPKRRRLKAIIGFPFYPG